MTQYKSDSPIPDTCGSEASGIDHDIPEVRKEKTTTHWLINIVYEHLQQAQVHGLFKDNVSVVWSAQPLAGCDLYAYLNANSYGGPQEGIEVLLLFEPPIVLPGQYDEQVWSRFDHIVVLCEGLLKEGKKFRRVDAPRSHWVVPVDITDNHNDRERRYPLGERLDAICMISGNKKSRLPGELYSKRLEAAWWFQKHSQIPFDVYGSPPFSLPNYKGTLATNEKLPTLARYKYCLCFENFYHPGYSAGFITEKVLDCFETRTIPIYLGCSNIEKYIPAECFIDFREFDGFADLDSYLQKLSKKRYKRYIHHIDEWVEKGSLQRYSWFALYDDLVKLLDERSGSLDRRRVGSVPRAWVSGISPILEDRAWVAAEARQLWSYDALAATVPPKVLAMLGERSSKNEITGVPEKSDPMKAVNPQGHLALAESLQAEGKYVEALDELEQIIESDVMDANAHYLYAQLLIVTGQFDRSMAALRKVLSLNPQHTYAHNDMGAIFQRGGLLDDAIDAYERAVFSDHRNHNALRNLLGLLNEMRRHGELARIAQVLLADHTADRDLEAVLEEFGLSPDAMEEANPLTEMMVGEMMSDERSGSCRRRAINYYRGLNENPDSDYTSRSLDRFVHPVWKKQLNTLGKLILDGLPEDFLHHPICLEMFVRMGWQRQQQYELEYLENTDAELRTRLFSVAETDTGFPLRDCPGHDISVNTLGMLWYCARISEYFGNDHLSVVEFGAGFGSFARVFNLFSEKPLTYMILDLPEMLALQLYYLSMSLGEGAVVPHLAASEPPVPHKINLYPVYGLASLDLTCDLFVSTFALSETPAFTQNMVCSEKAFFSASHVYLTGQLETERSELGWQKPDIILLSAVRRFPQIHIDRFHIGANYELIGMEAEQPRALSFMRTKGAAPGGERMGMYTRDESRRTGVIVFSKDRAMQLDCTLRSLTLHCADLDLVSVKVLYTTSNDLHENEYVTLRNDYPQVRFLREGDFRKDLFSLLSDLSHVLFAVDDNIFVRRFSVGQAVDVLDSQPDALGFSLRLGENTKYCYMLDRTQALPVFKDLEDGIVVFDWTRGECDFGYPLEVSSSIYRVSDLVPLLETIEFTNPNSLEFNMDNGKSAFLDSRRLLLSFRKSATFCNPINVVQRTYANRNSASVLFGPEELARLFADGYRVDVEQYRGLTPQSCHWEVDLKFAQVSASRTMTTEDAHPLVSIIILNYNNLDDMSLCLESVERNTPENHEVIVVDNGSTDGSVDFLKKISGIILIENTENLGCPRARAEAMPFAKGDFIVFLDSDTVVTPRWATKLIKHIASDDSIGVIGPRSNYVSGEQVIAQIPYEDVNGLERFATELSEQHQGQVTSTKRLAGFCMLFSRKVVDAIGSVDPSFGQFGFEDTDYVWRARVAGFKTVIANDVFVHHKGGPQGWGDSLYNRRLLEAWEVLKCKWGIPTDSDYDASYDETELLRQPFDASKHFVPLSDPSAIPGVIHDNRAEIQDGTTTEGGHSQGAGKNAAASETVSPDIGAAAVHREAVNLTRADKDDLALRLLQVAVEMDENNAEIWNDLGVLYYRRNDKEKAFECFTRSTDINPSDIESLRNKASVSLELGDWSGAIEAYEKVLSLDSKDIESLLSVGTLCMQADRHEDARMFFNEVIKIDLGNTIAVESLRHLDQEVGVLSDSA